MPNGQPDQNGFNRVAEVTLGATANKVISIGITTPKRKHLNSIHFSAANGISPAEIEDLIVKVCVCSKPGKLLGDPTILDFNPLLSAEGIDLGTVYYKNVITIPYNNPLIFDSPILFTEGDQIYVVCSVPYGVGDSLLTVQNRYCYLSVNGYYDESDNVKYKFR